MGVPGDRQKLSVNKALGFIKEYMNWKDPRIELPEHRQVVAILIYHWKDNWPQSAEISFGTTYHYSNENDYDRIVVENCDMVGSGSLRWHFANEYPDSDRIVAWCDAKDFQRPSFLKHNNHWGEEFSPF